MKLVSFAVPCFNSANYMAKCIESLLKAGEDVEIIIVNDGSTKDNTKEIADYSLAEYQEYILDLYHSAIEKDIALDYYAATSEREYIAQGFEAFVSIYKPHKILLDEHPHSNTRYKLFAQDPDLFNLIYKLVVNND